MKKTALLLALSLVISACAQDETAEIRMAAKRDDAAAQNDLGLMYAKGEGVPQDDAQAVVWFTKAAEQGYAEAQNNLGRMYSAGRGIVRDESEALDNALANKVLGHDLGNDDVAVFWFQKAAEQGHADAQCNLGVMYENAKGVERNLTQAVDWYRKSAEQGSVCGQFHLGYAYDDGFGVPQHRAEAAVWYRKAAAQGDDDAREKLAVLCKEKNYPACNTDDSMMAQAIAAQEKALSELRAAAEQGDAAAQFELGAAYDNGEDIAEDDAQTIVWYRKAAEQGNADAQFYLGRKYFWGAGGLFRDWAQAVAWTRKSAAQGHSAAQTELGQMYEQGDGVTQNYAQAMDWYRKATEQGDILAPYLLGRMYEEGRGVAKDKAMAVTWYRKAAVGLRDGKYKLDELCAEKSYPDCP
jgi:TPR repeat protein